MAIVSWPQIVWRHFTQYIDPDGVMDGQDTAMIGAARHRTLPANGHTANW